MQHLFHSHFAPDKALHPDIYIISPSVILLALQSTPFFPEFLPNVHPLSRHSPQNSRFVLPVYLFSHCSSTLLPRFCCDYTASNAQICELKSAAGSGLFMSSFVFLHIPTTISAIMGPYGYNEALNFFRYEQVEMKKRRFLISHFVTCKSANSDLEALILASFTNRQ